jgi:hypothetical protein
MDLLEGLVVGVHLFSVHSADSMNNSNPGIYLRAPAGFTAGVYENSISGTRFAGSGSPRRISTYAAWTFESASRRFAVTVGGATGYGRDHQVICVQNTPNGCITQTLNRVPTVVPFAVPTFRWTFAERTAARLGYVYTPEIGPRSRPVHGAHFMLERRY